MTNQFIPNDKIVQKNLDRVIAEGIVTRGPIRNDNIDHYEVKWNWKENTHTFSENSEMICDWPSLKYHYEKA